MEIRLKNGMPLMVGGQVAGSQECCCENPPPPRCFCADLCSYDVELVSPAITRVKIPSNDCLAQTYPTNTTSVFADDWVFPETDFGDFVPCTEAEELVGVIKPVSVFSVARRWSGDFEASTWVYVLLCEPADPGKEEAIVSIRVKLRMACDPTTEQLYVEVQSSAYVGDFNDEAFRSSIEVNNYGFYRPPSTCMVPGKRICITDPVPWFRTSFLDTPLDVIVRLDETSLGPYTLGRPEGEERGDSPNPYRAMYDSVVENTEFTFRITSRENCLPPEDCSCSYNLSGLQLQFQGEVFTVGNEPNDIRGRDSQRWVYTDSTTSPNIAFEVFNESFTETYFLASATISCSPSADPETVADKWLLTVSATCNTWDDDGNGGREIVEQTTKTWVGEYECYEHCGDFTPSGSPIQMVLVSTVTTPGLGACDPGSSPPTISVVGKAPCE